MSFVEELRERARRARARLADAVEKARGGTDVPQPRKLRASVIAFLVSEKKR